MAIRQRCTAGILSIVVSRLSLAVTTAFITHPDCLLHDMGAMHPECPSRLRAIDDQLIASGLDTFLKRSEAPLANDEQLARVHTADHIERVRAASPRSGLHHLDQDTAMC